MTGSPLAFSSLTKNQSSLALSMRIMHRWQQRMNGREVALLFLFASLFLLCSHFYPPAGPFSAQLSPPSASLWADFTITFLDMFLALGVAASGALLLAGLARLSPGFRVFLVPALSVARATPGLGLIGLIGAYLSPLLTIVLVAASGMMWRVATALLDAEAFVPSDFEDVARGLKLTGWQRFWRLQMPLSLPLVLMRAAGSMPGVWFRLICAQGIMLMMTHRDPGGIGSRALIGVLDHHPVMLFEAIGLTLVLVLAFDQGVTRPFVGWGERYRLDGPPLPARGRRESGVRDRTSSWMLWLWRHSAVLSRVSLELRRFAGEIGIWRIGSVCKEDVRPSLHVIRNAPSFLLSSGAGILFVATLFQMRVLHILPFDLLAGLLTLSHVCWALVLAVLFWVPLGLVLENVPATLCRRIRHFSVLAGLFPAVLLYPLFLSVGHLPVAVLLFLGTHWLVGSAILDKGRGASPDRDRLLLRHVARALRLRGLLLWQRVLLPLMAPDLCGGLLAMAMPLWNVVMIAEAFDVFSGRDTGLGGRLFGAILHHELSIQVLALTLFVLLAMLLDRLVLQPLAVHTTQKYALT